MRRQALMITALFGTAAATVAVRSSRNNDFVKLLTRAQENLDRDVSTGDDGWLRVEALRAFGYGAGDRFSPLRAHADRKTVAEWTVVYTYLARKALGDEEYLSLVNAINYLPITDEDRHWIASCMWYVSKSFAIHRKFMRYFDVQGGPDFEELLRYVETTMTPESLHQQGPDFWKWMERARDHFTGSSAKVDAIMAARP